MPQRNHNFYERCSHLSENQQIIKMAIGFYKEGQGMKFLCGDCYDIERNKNPNQQIFLITDLINICLPLWKSKINQQDVLCQEIQEMLQIVDNQFQQMIKYIKKELYGYKNDIVKLEQQQQKIKDNTPLIDDDYKQLSKISNKQINIKNNKIYNKINANLEETIKSITINTTQGSLINSLIQEMFQESPKSDIESIFFTPSDKNLAYDQLSLNQFVNIEVLKLKQNIDDILQQNSIPQVRENLNQFYYQDQENKYVIEDIDKFYNDVKRYLEASSRELIYRDQLEAQYVEFLEYYVYNNVESSQHQGQDQLNESGQHEINEEFGIINMLNIDQHQENDQFNQNLPQQNIEEHNIINFSEEGQQNENLLQQMYQNIEEPDQSSNNASLISFNDDDDDSFYRLTECLEDQN
ncbi:unnamed protein product [Paramecium octaurelia]|uniref:Uncharacterized protein n=1 Tax=Paramecium octaurelia TaxID=43137 RepID=A0A8S1VCR6_PAROT|nr:unnamed protein product [Paramecium octaurelia]